MALLPSLAGGKITELTDASKTEAQSSPLAWGCGPCSGSFYRRGLGLIPDPEISTGQRCGQKNLKNQRCFSPNSHAFDVTSSNIS